MRVKEYPLGTECDRNYRGVAFDFGLHRSPNGLIEYRSDVFGKELQGKLLVVRYSAGDDIIVLTPEENNPDLVKEASLRVKGFTGFNPSPLDLIENTANGHLYVAQLDEKTFQGKITLLRPMPQS
jgi:hypothetical protein